jgi:DNA-directed RNA polymerase specialized sigma24 family protein
LLDKVGVGVEKGDDMPRVSGRDQRGGHRQTSPLTVSVTRTARPKGHSTAEPTAKAPDRVPCGRWRDERVLGVDRHHFRVGSAAGVPAYADTVPDPVPDRFDVFAANHVGELMALARCLTSDTTESQQLVEDALIEASRSWQRGDGARLCVARRQLVRGYLGHRRPLPLRPMRGALELTDRSTVHGTDAGAVDPLGPEVLGQGLAEIAPRHLVTLALRVDRDLSVAETASVLRRTPAVVRRRERRAFEEVRLGADLAPAVSTGADEESDSSLRDSVRTALTVRSVAEFDATSLLQQVTERTHRTGGRLPSSRLVLLSAGIAAAALSVSLAVGTLLDHGQLDDVHSPDGGGRGVGGAVRPPAPPGMRLVGYRGLAVAVPANWRLQGSSCGRVVVLGGGRQHGSNGGSCAAIGPVSLTMEDALPNSPPLFTPSRRTIRVAGHEAQRSVLSRVEDGYQQTVFVFGADFLMTVRAPEKATVKAVVASLNEVPTGFAVVPDCESLPVHDAVAALTAVDLTSSIAHSSSLSTWRDEPPVIFQNTPSGAVVRSGTAVSLTIPGR